jgi:predicted enzyme related to lactoylglutathione lyase
MNDPLDALHTPLEPADPDPAFAADLRARLERALLHPTEASTVTSTLSTASDPTQADPDAARLHTVTPYLAVIDARAAVAFYTAAFGARPRGAPIVMPDGRVGHVEVLLGDSVLMMADEFPELDLVAPANRGGVSQSLRLEVADPDAVVAAAVAAGGTLYRPVADSPYGRGGVVLDPSGHRWMVSREAPESREAGGARPGDVVYAALWRPDVQRAERFYAAVLGWTVAAAHTPQGRHVTGLVSGLGLWGGVNRPTTMLCYTVPDVDGAVALVRAAGGTATDPTDSRYGRHADCVDDQGIPFALNSGGNPPDPDEPGGLSYVELRVPDPTAARAFYATVLGWRFTPGVEPGHWHMAGPNGPVQPWMGLTGGPAEPVVVPTFTVPDLAAAADAVRAAGGRAGDPSSGHDGTTADATDDQGAPFRLRQR